MRRSRSRVSVRCLLLVCLSVAAGCRTSGPAPEELRAVLERATERPAGTRRTAWSRVDSKWFAGEFKALLVEQRNGAARIRFQLMPELGGKVLDMVVTPDETVGYWPHAGTSFHEVRRDGEPVPPRGLIGFLSASLLENATPLTFDRVLSARRVEGGWRLEVRPAISGEHTRVEVSIADDGSVLSRAYEQRGVGWSEVFAPQHRIASRNFEWVLRDETAEALEAVPERLFELEIPAGIR